jgi:serine/threonine protein kinase
MPLGPITRNSTVAELQTFLKAAPEGSRIVGVPDPTTGESTLYAKKGSAGFFDRNADAERAAARDVVKDIFSRELKGHSREASKLLTNIKNAVDEKAGEDLRRGPMILLAKAANRRLGAEQIESNAITARHGGARLSPLGLTPQEVQQIGVGFTAALAPGGQTNQFANRLGAEMAAAFLRRQPPPTLQEQENFVLSDGKMLKAELLQQCNVANSRDARRILDRAFDRAASGLSVNQTVRNTATQLADSNRLLPDITLGGTVYHPIKVLGAGGQGSVFEYQSGTGDRIAVKLPRELPTDKSDAAKQKLSDVHSYADEYRMHRSALGPPPGHPNVLGLRGPLRTSDGQLGIVMDLAPHGTASSLATKIKNAEGTTLTPHEAHTLQLTVMQGMTQAVRQVQDVNRMIHFDIKPENFVLGADGNMKIIDFGTAAKGVVGTVPEVAKNPIYQAPEVVCTRDTLNERLDRLDTNGTIKAKKAKVEQALANEFPKTFANPRANTNPIMLSIMRPEFDTMDAHSQVTQKADTWALGMSFIHVCTGKVPYDSNLMSQIELGLKDWEQNSNSSALGQKDGTGKLPPHTLLEGTGHQATDSLISSLLDKDPNARPDTTTILANPLFSAPGVGTPLAKSLLVAIGRPTTDPNRDQSIAAAKAALNGLIGPPPGGPPPLPGLQPQPLPGLQQQPQNPPQPLVRPPPPQGPPPSPSSGGPPQPRNMPQPIVRPSPPQGPPPSPSSGGVPLPPPRNAPQPQSTGTTSSSPLPHSTQRDGGPPEGQNV